MSDRIAGQVLAGALSAAGVGRAFGRPLAGMTVTPIEDLSVAVMVASAFKAVTGHHGVAHLGEGELVVPGRSPEGGPAPAHPAHRLELDDAADLRALAPTVAHAARGSGVVVHVGVDPSSAVAAGPLAAAPAGPDWVDDDLDLDLDLERGAAAAPRVVVLAGPGVVDRDAVGGLRALAATGRLGVLNTWGAKGVFHWQSRHHWATVGLQELDFELGGLPDCDLVLVTGLDEREAPRRFWASYPHRIVPPEALAPLAERWPEVRRSVFAPLPVLRERLAAVTQAGWSQTSSPPMPTLVTRHYAEVLGNGGLVAADPGTAGFWIARSFPTTRLKSALVPAAPLRGWAAACVLVSRLTAPLRPVLGVTDGPHDAATLAVLAEAARLGVGIGLETWQDDGEELTPDEHLSRLGAMAGPEAKVATVRTDGRQLDEMVGVAGAVRAWSGDEAVRSNEDRSR